MTKTIYYKDRLFNVLEQLIPQINVRDTLNVEINRIGENTFEIIIGEKNRLYPFIKRKIINEKEEEKLNMCTGTFIGDFCKEYLSMIGDG